MYIFFFNDTATTEIYTYGHTLSLHDALPITWSDIASRTVADVGSLPSAIVRTTMSRSVTMPTSLSPSPTGRAPMFSSRLLRAASATLAAGLITSTSGVITSLIFIAFLRLVGATGAAGAATRASLPKPTLRCSRGCPPARKKLWTAGAGRGGSAADHSCRAGNNPHPKQLFSSVTAEGI